MTARARLLLFLVCLALLALFAFFMGKFVLGPPLPEVRVPAVAGKPEAEGLRILIEAGLAPETAAEYRLDALAGTILRTDPGENRLVRAGRHIRVDVAVAAPEISVPDLAGKPIEEAEILLARLGGNYGYDVGLVLRSVKEAAGDSMTPPGVVLSQDPPPGTLLAAGSGIDLVIAAAAEDTRVAVPNLQGKPYAEAEKMLHDLGLAVGMVQSLPVSSPPGTILATNPPPGRRVERASAVDLTIAGDLPAAQAPASRRIPVSYTIPDSTVAGNFQIFVRDASGDREVFFGKAKPGAIVSFEVEIRGDARFRVLRDGKEVDGWEL